MAVFLTVVCCTQLALSPLFNAAAIEHFFKYLVPIYCLLQICLWCYRKIQESDNPRCPKCRRAYGEGENKLISEVPLPSSAVSHNALTSPSSTITTASILPSDLQRGSLADDRQFGGDFGFNHSDVDSVPSSSSGRSSKADRRPRSLRDLRDLRVIRRDLCYIVGLPLEVVVDDSKLKCFEYFGKYGKVVNIIVNRNPNFKAPDKKKSCALYVTYSIPDEAKAAIMDLDESLFEGRRLKASYGTTKYCSNFLRKAKCQNRQCFYLHERGADEDSFTVAEMNQVKETSRGLTCSALLASEFEKADWKDSSNLFGKARSETIDYFVNHPVGRKRSPFRTISVEVEGRRQALLAAEIAASNLFPAKIADKPAIEAPTLIVLPPPPYVNSNPIVHPALNRSKAHTAPDFRSIMEDLNMLSLPHQSYSEDDELPYEANAHDDECSQASSTPEFSTSLQPGRLYPQAPSSLLSAYVTPADQIALRSSSSKYFSPQPPYCDYYPPQYDVSIYVSWTE
eukprot:Blabericola_migrator_1__5203@NODE_267_length_10594_cov_56_602451_g223_i0_p2_GENE_NODE_267_length_10594_cov_56_602451_g223_i0NODE_267_length_10594_cov_56_602451_g223_i0_p2_ORF_typecomplete_len510_score65_03RRM_1/PF00076_22/3_8e08zfRING_4/PF14570_6/3_8e07RRM_5/PF13893_6/0_064Nup35_RRM_2/PF14605_6/0_19DUF3408/PF11888_8/0_24DUF4831/PF16115_5/0_18ProkRING_4/PF14447_6/0_33zfC3HC4_3/PF13920_6/0_14zfC3HC4_3/PF13920_6/1_8e04_NODE_267_length_10594_cov_56_602451_g223_i061937722